MQRLHKSSMYFDISSPTTGVIGGLWGSSSTGEKPQAGSIRGSTTHSVGVAHRRPRKSHAISPFRSQSVETVVRW